jgi:hypothetical protein
MKVVYRPGLFAMWPRPGQAAPTPAVNAPDRVDIMTNAMLVAVAGVVVTQWEKLAGWVIAGFAAALALVLANYAKVVDITSAAAVHALLIMFVIAAILHVFQKLATTFVQAAVAGGEVGEKMKAHDLPAEELPRLFEGVASAYVPPLSTLMRASFRKLLAGNIAHVGSIVLRTALGAAALAILQVLLGLGAIEWLGLALHIPAA